MLKTTNPKVGLYENFLRRDGRLNRWRYFKRGILVGIMGIVLALILSIIVAIVTSSEFLTGLTFVVAVTFISLYLQYGLIIRRCHDLKQDSWLHSFIEKMILQ